MLRILVDLVVLEEKIGGCVQKPVEFVDFQLVNFQQFVSQFLLMCASFCCRSDDISDKGRCVCAETC